MISETFSLNLTSSNVNVSYFQNSSVKYRCTLILLFTLVNVGQNFIKRRSDESNVTIPFQQAYDHQKPPADDAPQKDKDRLAFCGCGWPSNMLIPRGKRQNFACQLFVMISDGDEDQVKILDEKSCKDAFAYCGKRDEKYPDLKPMGYPFDRISRNVSKSAKATKLKDFLTPNMMVADVSIVHENSLVKCPTISKPVPGEDDGSDGED